MTFKYSISKNHYNGYKFKEAKSVSELLQDLATKCVSPVTEYKDKELTSVDTGKTWMSKNHRSNPTIVGRGNMGMIDYEGSPENFTKLIKKIEDKELWYVAIPSQSNKSDKKNARYHIMYILAKSYSINSEAYKKQAKEFFDYIGYKWDDPDSGIDTRASFNGCGYFAPTIQLATDKGKGAKKISDPYLTNEDIVKDTHVSRFKGEYTPTTAASNEANEEFTNIIKRGRKLDDKYTKIVRTTSKGYVLAPETHIEVNNGRFMTFEKLVETLEDSDSENPRISMLGCPICNPGHTAPTTVGYAYMQFDYEGKPYICCTGNACASRPYFTMAEGDLAIYRIGKGSDYVLLKDEQLVYTHKENETYEHTSDSIIGELYQDGLAILDDYGNINSELTRKHFCLQAERLDVTKNPWIEEGIDYNDMTFNISKPAKFEPTEADPDEVISEAIKVFDNDVLIGDYPAPLVYLAYYLFHDTRIMASLFLVNHKTGSGKTFWTYELPAWFLGETKVGLMDRAAMTKNWGDVKLGKRLVVFEDIDGLTKQQVNEIASDIKTMTTAAGSNIMLDIKGRGQMKSYGYNILGTSNDEKQVPVSGEEDRRIYISEVRVLENANWIREQLMGTNGDKHKANAINYLYKIYNHVKRLPECHDSIFYRVPKTAKKKSVTDSQSNDGIQAMNIIRRNEKTRLIIKELEALVVSSTSEKELRKIVEEIDIKNHNISGATLDKLWKVLPSGANDISDKSYKQLGKIFGLLDYKTVVVNGSRLKGFKYGN